MSSKVDASVTFFNGNDVKVTNGVYVWQGIARNFDNKLIMVGTTNPSPTTGEGVVYIGNRDFTNYKAFNLNVPNSEFTSIYGCRFLYFDENENAIYRFVGAYNNLNDVNTYAFVYEGPLQNVFYLKGWKLKVAYQYLKEPINFAHSTDGVLVVGNSGNVETNEFASWIYDVRLNRFHTYNYPGAQTTTLYGIVQNTETSYTICGGFTDAIDKRVAGFVSDIVYDVATGNIVPQIESFTTLSTLNIKHFEGISKTKNPDVYTLAADGIGLQDKNTAFALKCKRIENERRFIFLGVVELKYNDSGFTTSNSIQNNVVVGFYNNSENQHVAWSATINNF